MKDRMNIDEYRKFIAGQKTSEANPIKQRIGRNSRAVGSSFEDLIESSCMWYQEAEKAYIEKTPEPMKILGRAEGPGQFIACFTKPAQPDYKGTMDGRSIVFEAKHTDADRILRDRLSDEQMDALDRHAKMGADSFVLVSFGLAHFYRVPWLKWENMKEAYGKLYLRPDDIEEYEVPFTGTVIKFLG